MTVSRRKFIKLSLNSAVVLSAGNIMQPFDSGFFIPASSENISMRFAIASDGHYGEDKTQFEMLHDQMIQWINAEKQNRGVDFTLINGDIIHNDFSFLTAAKKKWDKLAMPYYVSHGNHDQTSEAYWESLWNRKWHFAFNKKGAAFLVLNSADDRGNYICPDVEWRKFQLEKFADKKHLFVFMHITPFSWTGAGLPCPDIVDLFNKQQNLKAVFHGHDHDQD
ncbi:MAG: metallophosphoesterase, partial [Ginsengibacter sp.]